MTDPVFATVNVPIFAKVTNPVFATTTIHVYHSVTVFESGKRLLTLQAVVKVEKPYSYCFVFLSGIKNTHAGVLPLNYVICTLIEPHLKIKLNIK